MQGTPQSRFSHHRLFLIAGACVLVLALSTMIYGQGDQISAKQQRVNDVSKIVGQIHSGNYSLSSEQGRLGALFNDLGTVNASLAEIGQGLPLTDATPTVVNVTIGAAPSGFEPPFIIVNQGDTVRLTYVSNDTVGHDLKIDAPYNFNINGSLPGMLNDVTEKTFTTPPTNNSPGVQVYGRVGAVTGTGTFVAQYPGIFVFYCIYHLDRGMFGYMVVSPDAAYHGQSQQASAAPPSSTTGIVGVHVSLPKESGASVSSIGYDPARVVLVLGVNATMTWTNDDTVPHTVTALNAAFNSGNMNPGDAFTFTFTTPGTYTYTCIYHPWQKAEVIVLPAHSTQANLESISSVP